MEATVFKFKFDLDKDMKVRSLRIGNTMLIENQLIYYKKPEDDNVLEGKLTAIHGNQDNLVLSILGLGKPGTKGTFSIANEKGEPLLKEKVPLQTLAGGRFRFLKKDLPFQPIKH